MQGKCDAFADRVVKLNDYLLEQAANKKAEVLRKKSDGKPVFKKPVPVYLQSISVICNQLLRSGTSVGANNSEATSAISKADYKSKSYIALKEARESLYWINLLHRNGFFIFFLTQISSFIPQTSESNFLHLATKNRTSSSQSA